jgi:hypothetical protein
VNGLVAVACVVTALFGALLGRVIREREEFRASLLVVIKAYRGLEQQLDGYDRCPSIGEVQRALLGEGVTVPDEQVREWSPAQRRDVMESSAAPTVLARVVEVRPADCLCWAPLETWLSEAKRHGLPAPAPGIGPLMASLESVVVALDALAGAGALEMRMGALPSYRIVAAPKRDERTGES